MLSDSRSRDEVRGADVAGTATTGPVMASATTIPTTAGTSSIVICALSKSTMYCIARSVTLSTETSAIINLPSAGTVVYPRRTREAAFSISSWSTLISSSMSTGTIVIIRTTVIWISSPSTSSSNDKNF